MTKHKQDCVWCKDAIKRSEAPGSVRAKCTECKTVWYKVAPSFFENNVCKDTGAPILTFCTNWRQAA